MGPAFNGLNFNVNVGATCMQKLRFLRNKTISPGKNFPIKCGLNTAEWRRSSCYVHSGGQGMHMIFLKIFSLAASHDELIGGHSGWSKEGGAKIRFLFTGMSDLESMDEIW